MVSDQAKSILPPAGRRKGWPWKSILPWGLVAAAVWAAHAPALRAGFIWDDNAHVTAGALRSWDGLVQIWTRLGAVQQYYPVLHSVFWLEHRCWGDAPAGYHWINLLWHALAAGLFARVLLRLGLSEGASWLAALIFAVHPVETESVAWISEQKNTLSLVFYLAAALAYLRFDDSRRPGQYAAAATWFLLALLTKSVTATLPGAILVVLWWRRGRLEWSRDIRPVLPLMAAGVAAGLFTAWVERIYIGAQGAAFDLNVGQRLLLAGRVVWFYLGKLAWPHPLIFFYPRWTLRLGDPAQWLYPLAAGAVTAGLWLLRRRGRGPLAAWLCFVGSLAPALGFINVYPFVFSFVADHFQYLASLGPIALAAAWLSQRLRGRAALACAALLLIGLGALSWRECGQYRDAETLYGRTLELNPRAWLAHLNLANIRYERGDVASAADHYGEAERLNADYASTHFNFGKLLMQTGQWDRAAAEFEWALQLSPGDAEACNNLGIVLAQSGHPAEAERQLRRALALRPGYLQAHYNLGVLLTSEGRAAEGQAQLDQARQSGGSPNPR